jgi:hypothetical protein
MLGSQTTGLAAIKMVMSDKFLGVIDVDENGTTRLINELRAEIERLRVALTEITELDLEGDASLGDALAIADEAINPPPAG